MEKEKNLYNHIDYHFSVISSIFFHPKFKTVNIDCIEFVHLLFMPGLSEFFYLFFLTIQENLY